MDIFAQNILEHSRCPHHQNKIDRIDASFEASNPSCGDEVNLRLQLDDKRKSVIGVQWKGEGCAISQAGMSLLSDWLIGKSVSQINTISSHIMHELLGVEISPRRIKCALLGLYAAKNALSNSNVSWNDVINI